MNATPLIITAALPYANGSIHLGHLVEYIQTDIFARFWRMRGRQALYFCADDTHGAPIMIRARTEGVSPESVIERYHQEHLRDFTDFQIIFDNYHSTNSEENRRFSEEIFLKLQEEGSIAKRDVEQAYCEHDKMFLPDRFVIGLCPRCGAEGQYGDSCDSCGAHYNATELKTPTCSLCGSPPVRRSSSHYFFRVADHLKTIETFMQGDRLQPEVKNFLATWLKEGLKEWDISRDGPYFGFTIPGEDDKYFYVWLDAPVGYIAAAKNWADKTGVDFDSLWRPGKQAEIHHFIGKDIVYFHTLFWLPMLQGSGFALPDKIQVHGFLTVNGEKMSKSKGTFISARNYLDNLDPEYLRYYYASKLKNSVDDIDLSFEDFLLRVNAELVNKIANLGSRAISMLNKRAGMENRLKTLAATERPMIDLVQKGGEEIASLYEKCDYAPAIRKIVAMADNANVFFDEAKPWTLKDDPQRFNEVITAAVNAFRLIVLYLKPVAPLFAEKTERILKIEPLTWADHQTTLENHCIGPFERLADRVEQKAITRTVEAAQKDAEKTRGVAHDTQSPEITFDDFATVDLRTAVVRKAEPIPKADKLLKLTLDVGGVERTIAAGIAQHYTPEEITGKTVVIVANLKPRKLRGVVSQGMLLAVNDGDTLRLLSPDGGVPSGLKVS